MTEEEIQEAMRDEQEEDLENMLVKLDELLKLRYDAQGYGDVTHIQDEIDHLTEEVWQLERRLYPDW